MTTSGDIAARVDALHHAAEASLDRFDAGPELRGRVLLLPSAFNPPTHAHIALLGAGRAFGYPAALLSTHNVDKGLGGAGLDHRIGMLLETARGHDIAVFATNAARFVDQARAARRAHPDVRFDFIVGYDTLTRIFEPRYYADMAADLAELFAHHGLIAANRADATAEIVAEFVTSGPAAPFADRITLATIDADHALLSSTEARDQIRTHGGSRVVPTEVEEYIRRHRLYRADQVR